MPFPLIGSQKKNRPKFINSKLVKREERLLNLAYLSLLFKPYLFLELRTRRPTQFSFLFNPLNSKENGQVKRNESEISRFVEKKRVFFNNDVHFFFFIW